MAVRGDSAATLNLQAYRPWNPLIVATVVQSDEWNVTTKTRAPSSNLVVLNNTALTLVCLAAYPVFWYKNETASKDPRQRHTCDTFFNKNTEYCPNTTYSFDQSTLQYVCNEKFVCKGLVSGDSPRVSGNVVPFFGEYEAVLEFENVTNAISDTWTCRGELEQENLKTSVHISIRALDANGTPPYLVQSGFSNVHLTQDDFISSPQYPFLHYPFRFVYLSILDSGSPALDGLMADGRECHLRDQPPEPEFDYTGTSAVSVSFAWDMYSKCRIFEFVLGNITLDSIRANILNSHGATHIDTQRLGVSETADRELSDQETSDFLFVSNVLNNIKITAKLPEFTRTWLHFRKVETETGDSFVCHPQPMSNASAEVCGIISATMTVGDMEADTRRRLSVYDIILNPKIPCYVELVALRLNVTDILIFDLFKFEVASNQYFNTSLEEVRIISFSEGSSRNSIEAFENQNVTLQCLVPACRPTNNEIGWCLKDDPSCDVRFTSPADSELHVSDPAISVSRGLLSDKITMSLNLTFTNIRMHHKGTYSCGIFPEDGVPIIKSFDVDVVDPIAPIFTENMSNSTGTTLLLPVNQTRRVKCDATGRPSPEFSWFIVEENDKLETLNWSDPMLTYNRTGTYICIATNFQGYAKGTFRVKPELMANTNEASSKANPVVIAVISLLGAVLILLLLILLIWRMTRKNDYDKFKILAQELHAIPNAYIRVDKSAPLNVQTSVLSYDRALEIDRRSFTIKSKVLGTGEFGIIYKGELASESSSDILVAVKMPKDFSNLQHHRSLVEELKIMCHIEPHINVLFLLGACTNDIERRQLFVLTEYCHHGSLKDYLVENRPTFEIFDGAERTVGLFLSFAYQAANGMEHLGGQNIIHRDLALRNLLLTDTHIVKIADFGMSRKHDSVYRKALSPDIPIPIFWMSLESLFSEQYTQKSDVWSFGIVLWEMFNCGRRPYPDHEPDMAFRSWLRASEHNRLGPPKIVCDEIYALMRDCWKVDADKRPTFSQCKRSIGQCLENRSRSMYVLVIQNISNGWRNIPPEILSRGRRPPDGGVPICLVEESEASSEHVGHESNMPAGHMAIGKEVVGGSTNVAIEIETGEPSPYYVTNGDIEMVSSDYRPR